ncbi:MAG TPA: response regulator transcription factor [Blastocatellia bacterium]|nr:response regulator transcription factor [Blastocatellia bacterium]
MAKRLLLVDDEPNLLLAVGACLRSEGYDVTSVRSGADALVSLAETIPDLVISDIKMPGIDGRALLQRIRASSRTALIPVIFLTAKDQKSDRIEGFRAGVDAYVTKPFEPDELVAVIRSIFSRLDRTREEFARLVGAPADALHEFQDEELTEAEGRIADAVARGLSNKEIASELGISVRTVENHISHILVKKGFSNRVEIARYVLGRRRPDFKIQVSERK